VSTRKRPTDYLRRNAVFTLVGAVLGMGAVSGVRADALTQNCYSDTRCLAREATSDIGRVRQDDLGRFASDLGRLSMFDLAHSVVQRIDRSTPKGHYNWQSANNDIAVEEIAFHAFASPQTVASFSPLDALTKPESEGLGFNRSAEFRLLADVLIHRSPWAPMDTDLSNIFRPKMLRAAKNATLSFMLTTAWPEAIRALPPTKQGWEWNNLANVWLELGDFANARKTVAHAEEVGLIDFQGVQRIYDQTWRTWFALTDYDRALNAAERASDKPRAGSFKLDIAHALIKAGHLQQARSVITAALADAEIETNSHSKMDLLHYAADLRIAADDALRARPVTAEMVELAHRHDMIPSAQLALAASTLNDLGDHVQALKLLREATEEIPGDKQVIGLSAMSGPITGGGYGLADSLRSEIAVEFHRAGNLPAFDEQMRQMSVYYRTRTWGTLCEGREGVHWSYPSEQTCIDKTGPSILLHLAVQAVVQGKPDVAKRHLQRAIVADQGGNPSETVPRLMNIARMAAVNGNGDLTAMALNSAAKAADRSTDPGNRAAQLATVAALRKELVG